MSHSASSYLSSGPLPTVTVLFAAVRNGRASIPSTAAGSGRAPTVL